ncbi:MAG: hypothetical protein ACI9FW_002347 [Flavobacterium sp.]|jgi:hypothetical protein
MIKFFRKIRYDLMEKNKLTQYFKYAIGEIVLVVIGILIAISISAWNIERNLGKSNEVYLVKLIEELNSNINRLDYLVSSDYGIGLDSVVKNCLYILPRFSKGLEKSDYEFLLNNKKYLGSSQLNLNDATYEELLNTGKLYSFGSDSLIKAVKDYYKRYEREKYYNEVRKNEGVKGNDLYQRAMMRLNIDYYFNPETFSLHNHPWVFDKNSKNYFDLQLGIVKFYQSQYQDLNRCIELKEDTNKLIEIIEKELKEKY